MGARKLKAYYGFQCVDNLVVASPTSKATRLFWQPTAVCNCPSLSTWSVHFRSFVRVFVVFMALSRVVQDLKVVKGFHSVVESVLKDGSIVLLTKQTEQGNACVVVPVLASCKVSPARFATRR